MLKIVYYCYGSAHSSVIAASIHLGRITIDRIPKAWEIASLPHYDQTKSSEIGRIFHMGTDEFENEVYIIGMGRDRKLVKKVVISFLRESNVDVSKLILVSTLENVNFKTRLGGYLSRRLGFIRIGRPLTIKGIQERYWDFTNLVENTKKNEVMVSKTLD